jgi:aminoglycoside/choline kinase family phosphotransferase
MTEPLEATADPAMLAPFFTSTVPVREIQPLPGDVSPRRYYRVLFEDGASAILATYPPQVRDSCPRFLATTALLESAGVRVPKVLSSDCEEGWMLVEDLGPETLGDWGRGRPWKELAGPFEKGLEIALRIAALPEAGLADLNPVLGRELLAKELKQTWDLFLEPEGLLADAALAAELKDALDALCGHLGAERPVPCHRDFMARNLMLAPEGDLVVLDHQDLRLGPPFYDVASLLNDTLFPPEEAEEALLARALGPADDRVLYERAAAQRTLKAVGTYAKFARMGANRHLPLIPPTLARFVKHFGRVPEGAPLAARLSAAWSAALPAPVVP